LYGANVPLYKEYQTTVRAIDELPKEYADYRTRIFGAVAIVKAPLDYYITQIEQTLGIEAVRELEVSDLAKHIAVIQLKNMINVLDIHYREQIRARKQ
jgi:hypothetical protein